MTQTVSQGTTLTGVASSLNASVFGNSVTFTATVTVSTGVGPRRAPSSSSTELRASAQARWWVTQPGSSTAALAVGSHAITAVFSGDASFLGDTSPALTQVVQMGTTQTLLVSSLNPSVEGNLVTFTATVSPLTGSGPQTGTVQFRNGAANLGSPVALANGQASLGTSALIAGIHNITAVYSGDINFIGSISTARSQNVLRATTTVVTSNRNPSANLGQNITFTATVKPALGTGFPTTGTIQFSIDRVNVGALVALNAQGRRPTRPPRWRPAATTSSPPSAGRRCLQAVRAQRSSRSSTRPPRRRP